MEKVFYTPRYLHYKRNIGQRYRKARHEGENKIKLTYRKKRKPALKLAILKGTIILLNGFLLGIIANDQGDLFTQEEVAEIVQVAEDNSQGKCPLNQDQIAQLAHFETVILGGLK